MSENKIQNKIVNDNGIKLTEESHKIIEKLETKEKLYQRKINQLQKENIILTNKIHDLDSQNQRLRSQKMDYQKELEMTKHKVSILEKEIDGLEIMQSCASFSQQPNSPEKNLQKLKRKIMGYKEKFHIDTAKKEEIVSENIRLVQVLEENEMKYERAQKIIDQIERYEVLQDSYNVTYKKLQAILTGFFNDFEEIRIYQNLDQDIISNSFFNFSEKVRSYNKEIQFVDHEFVQDSIMALLGQIEFGIKTGLNFKNSHLEIEDELSQKSQLCEELNSQVDSMQQTVQNAIEDKSLFEDENNHLKDEIVALAERYDHDKSIMFKKLSLDLTDEQFQLKSDNEKLVKENQFLDEIMSKLVNLMPSQDIQELLSEIITVARQILVSEKERIYIEQLLDINEQNLKIAIHSLTKDISEDDICQIRRNVEKYREILKNCTQQKQLMINDLSELLSKLDRAAIIQTYRLQAIRTTEKDEIINQAYLELIQKDDQKQKTQQSNDSSNIQKNVQEVQYISARELLQQKSTKREGNPLLSKINQQQNQDLLDEELPLVIDQKLQQSLQNASFTIKSILSNNIFSIEYIFTQQKINESIKRNIKINHSYKDHALMNERDHNLQRKREKIQLIEDDQAKEKGLLQKHMLLKRNQFIQRGENPLNLDIDKSQDDYFSKLDYSKSNASELILNQQDQVADNNQ